MPLPVSRPRHETKVPPPVLDPEQTIKAIILSTTTLRNHSLIAYLRDTLVLTSCIERDLASENQEGCEGDIIVSPNRCIIILTFAQITQALPSNTSTRILAVAAKYRQLEILVICSDYVKGKDIALFSGWLEMVGQEHNIRLFFVNGGEVCQWTGWLCLWRCIDGPVGGDGYLQEEEIEVLSFQGARVQTNSWE